MFHGVHEAATKVFTEKKGELHSYKLFLSFCITAPTARSVDTRPLFALVAFRFPTSLVFLVYFTRHIIERMWERICDTLEEFPNARVTNHEL